MTIRSQLAGIWVVAIWALAHVIPGVVLAADTGGSKGLLLWLLVAAEILLAAGLVMGWRFFRYLVMAQLCVHALLFSLIAWAFLFVAFAWGLHGNEVAILSAVTVYVLFISWGFVYMFSPSVDEYFARQLPAMREALASR
jgi:hypothetical protein